MRQPDSDGVLLVCPSTRQQLPSIMIVAGFLCLYLILGGVGVMRPRVLLFGVLVFGGILLIALVTELRARRMPWELRLDGAGVTVRGRSVVPWNDLAEVRVTGLKPVWLFRSRLGCRAVCFIGKPGTVLPVLPSQVRRWSELRAQKQRGRLYGTQLVVHSITADSSVEAITDSIRRWSTVPVRSWR